jgi:hypothetical protein
MFKNGLLSNFNDSYYLMKYDNTVGICDNHLCDIQNINSFNYLASNLKNVPNWPVKVLCVYFNANNVYRPDYIYKLVKNVIHYNDILNIFTILINKNLCDVIKLLLNDEQILKFWIRSFDYTMDFNKVKQEINSVIAMDIVTPENIYRRIEAVCFFSNIEKLGLLKFMKNTYGQLNCIDL